MSPEGPQRNDLHGGGAPPDQPLVTVYQSALYADMIPEATWEIARRGIGEIEIVPAVAGESPAYGENLGSLEAMRARMFDPASGPGALAALFIGGMDGIHAEHGFFAGRFPDALVFAIGRPGGAAAELARDLVTLTASLAPSPTPATTGL